MNYIFIVYMNLNLTTYFHLERHFLKKFLESVVEILDKTKLYQNDDVV